jgi:hypothetical protein
MSVPDKIINKIKGKILHTKDYKYVSDHNLPLKLSDHIVLYNLEDTWKIIPLTIALSYPIIYDKCTINNEIYNVTIVVCPITLRSNMFKGIFEFETYQNYTMILKEKNSDSLIAIDLGYKMDKKYIVEQNRRSEIKLLNLRSALISSPDAQFMITSVDTDPIMDIDYYSSVKDVKGKELDCLVHPKTLVYIIQYKSYDETTEKLAIILGRDMNKFNATGYDVKKSGLFEYLGKYRQKIINRGGYIMPMLWYFAKDIYKTAKVVYVI